MPDKLIILPAAEADLNEQVSYLDKASSELALRFLDDLRGLLAELLRFPRLGRLWATRNPELRGVRRLTMTRFGLSVFYRPGEDNIEIIRVLHHSRALPAELKN